MIGMVARQNDLLARRQFLIHRQALPNRDERNVRTVKTMHGTKGLHKKRENAVYMTAVKSDLNLKMNVWYFIGDLLIASQEMVVLNVYLMGTAVNGIPFQTLKIL